MIGLGAFLQQLERELTTAKAAATVLDREYSRVGQLSQAADCRVQDIEKAILALQQLSADTRDPEVPL